MTSALRPFVTAVFLLGATACLEPNSPDLERVGFLNAIAHVNGADHVLRVDGTFYEGFNLSVAVFQPEFCRARPLNTVSVASPRTLEAGNALTATVSAQTTQVARVAVGPLVRYTMAEGEGLPYTPGDTLEVVIPGAADGFPAATIKLRTAEPFTADPIPPPEVDVPIEAVWTPSPAPGSLMTLSLRYSSSPTSSTPNSEIFCAWVDDGSATVPTALTNVWADAPEGSRSYEFARVREHYEILSARRRVRLFSFYQLPVPTLGGI